MFYNLIIFEQTLPKHTDRYSIDGNMCCRNDHHDHHHIINIIVSSSVHWLADLLNVCFDGLCRLLRTRITHFCCFLPGLLRQRLGGECPKIVRVYSAAIEMKDYPVPGGDLRTRRGMHDMNSDQDLTVRRMHVAQVNN